MKTRRCKHFSRFLVPFDSPRRWKSVSTRCCKVIKFFYLLRRSAPRVIVEVISASGYEGEEIPCESDDDEEEEEEEEEAEDEVGDEEEDATVLAATETVPEADDETEEPGRHFVPFLPPIDSLSFFPCYRKMRKQLQ